MDFDHYHCCFEPTVSCGGGGGWKIELEDGFWCPAQAQRLVVYSVGESWLCSEDTAGLYFCTGAGSSSFHYHSLKIDHDISVRCATGFIFPQSWPPL